MFNGTNVFHSSENLLSTSPEKEVSKHVHHRFIFGAKWAPEADKV